MKLQDLNQYELQDIYDVVAKHLLKQNKQCIAGDPNTNNTICKYRHENMMCAVGVLIADEDYSSKLEGQGVKELLNRFTPMTEELTSTRISLLSWLQNIHDSFTVDQWKDCLENCAKHFNLNTEVINAH
jgi:hypothetical protein